MNSFLPQSRHIPWSTRLAVLFGSGLQPHGWVTFSLGLVLVHFLMVTEEVTSLFQFRGMLEKTEGVIVSSEKSTFSSGGTHGRTGSRSKGISIYKHEYTYQVNGVMHQGASYSKNGALARAQKIQVEFPRGKPEKSRAQGMRVTPYGPGAVILLMCPISGLAMAFTGLFIGWRNLNLLKRGELARGKMKDKIKTNSQVFNQYVYKMTFQYTTRLGKQHEVKTKTHRPEKLEDDSEERLLYDPLRPSRAAFMDTLPGEPAISSKGQVTAVNARSLLRALVPPIIALVVIGVGVVLKLP